MPFDMIQGGGGNGGGDGNMLVKALSIVIGSIYNSGARSANFEPGQIEVVNLDITIKVSEDGKQFRVESARTNRWEQIEIDPEVEDLIGD